MKEISPLLGVVIAVVPLSPASAAPGQIQAFMCPPCPIQSKTPSRQKGKFDYKVKCTDPDSGNSAVLDITAVSDRAAMETAWHSPKLDEIVVGMESNGYACAEPPEK
ncbi:MAG TPA: hypothetical protein VG798_00900 [Rhizomicrobium sp.]|nr:hypothetical protein [Rhizomicrobium sp.]